MTRDNENDKGYRFFSRLLFTGSIFLVISWDISRTANGKSNNVKTIQLKQNNSSKRHAVVTEEEVEDTFFATPQQPYPAVVSLQFPVPVVAPVASSPQPVSKKPKNEHPNEFKEHHALLQPQKVQSKNDNEAKKGKNDEVSGYPGNSKATADKACLTDKSSKGASKSKKTRTYRNIGCYKDALPRAVPILEGSDPILDGYYKNRQHAVEKCAQVAKSRGYQLFTIQNGGFCSSGPVAQRTFQIYGPASNCNSGRGGKWASDVYVFKNHTYELTVHTGNEQKASTDAKISVSLYGVMGSSRHISLTSHAAQIINDPFQRRQVDKFKVQTVPIGDITRLHVCLDDTNPSNQDWYLEKISVKDLRNKIFIFPCNCWLKAGKSKIERNLFPGNAKLFLRSCPLFSISNTTPSHNSNSATAVVINPGPFKYIGCVKKAKPNVIDQDYKILDGRPSTHAIPGKVTDRINADYVLEICAQDSRARGLMFFGIHNGNQCLGSSKFQDVYQTYDRAYDCAKTGRGGPESIAIYTFIDEEPDSKYRY